MQDLLPIGRFSRLSRLTVKALRLYDKRGLLRPAVVDFKTGFRYYSRDQAHVAARIRAFRALEMPLDDIAALLSASDPAVAQACLARHRRRIEERIERYRQALTYLHAHEQQCAEKNIARSARKEPAMDTVETTTEQRASKPYQCSFCGKDNAEVRRMIAGPNGVFICGDCVERCNEIIARAKQEEEAQAALS